MTESSKKTGKKEASLKEKPGFNALSVQRIRSLLENPDLSPSQRKTLLNLLKRLESA